MGPTAQAGRQAAALPFSEWKTLIMSAAGTGRL
jgi:hypothetical protein